VGFRAGHSVRIAFRNEAALPEGTETELVAEADRRLRALMDGHTDITGASVAVEELTGDATPHTYEARVVVSIRPHDVFAAEKHETVEGALNGALDGVERQVRENRTRLRETWKQA
jgi:ribosome-associated translation inhibitor RaiA